MVHTFSLLGQNIAVDVNSGAVHVLDDITYAVVRHMKDATTPLSEIAAMLPEYAPKALSESYHELQELVKRGADTIAFASCIRRGTPIGYPCPFADKMKELVARGAGEGVRLLDYTH